MITIQKLFKNLYKRCECGCGSFIPIVNKSNKFLKFKQGHYIKYFLKNNHHYNYKGGKSKNGEGYILIWNPKYPTSNKMGRIFVNID